MDEALAAHPAGNWEDLVLYLGGSPGSFTGMLLTLAAKADPRNLALLRGAFPRQVTAWEAWVRHSPATWGELDAILAGESGGGPGSGVSGHDHQLGYLAPDPGGRQINGQLLGELAGACLDGCQPCQEALLSRLTGDAATTARLVELACIATSHVLGGIPASMTRQRAPGLASPEFRRLAAAGADGNNDAMFALCAQMTPAQRREAAETAAEILTGHLVAGGAPPGALP